jgi:Cys-tRNA(Pro)/Cys-tRNA(Cys) deacylase
VNDSKTNATRIVEEKCGGCEVYSVELGKEGFTDAAELAGRLGLERERVFKTLVTEGKSGAFYVFMVPCGERLDLKKAARACGEKNLEMLPQKDLLKVTGYVHGGCSPVAMKKQFPTWIDESCVLFDKICFSAGRPGFLLEVGTERFLAEFPVECAELTV